jgi:hypothetical protein
MNVDPARPEGDDEPVEFTLLRPVDIARERTQMCEGALDYNAAALNAMMDALYGEALSNTVGVERHLVWARALKRHMRACELLLIETDLLSHAMAEIETMSDEQLSALPPLPERTIVAFESPLRIRVLEQGVLAYNIVSVLVPFEPSDLPIKSLYGTAFVAYARLSDRKRVASDDREERRILGDLSASGQVWLPSFVGEMEAPITESDVSLGDVLRLALARAGEPRTQTLPRPIQQAAEGAGVKRPYRRAVRIIDLARGTAPIEASERGASDRMIGVSFEVGGHWRRYRDEEGEVVKKIWIKSYPKGEGLPPKAPSEKVKVARDPEGTRFTMVDRAEYERILQAVPGVPADLPMGPWYLVSTLSRHDREAMGYPEPHSCIVCGTGIQVQHRTYYELISYVDNDRWLHATMHRPCAAVLARDRFPDLDFIDDALL